MKTELADLDSVVAVARERGFRPAARSLGTSASRLSDAVRRVEAGLGVRLFNRTTRSITPTEAGRALLARLTPALDEVEAALDGVNAFRDSPSGLLRLNVPVSAARLVLPHIVPPFLAAYPDIRLEVMTDSSVTDVVRAGCDAGIRYAEHLEPDMIAVPIGPREERLAHAATTAYLDRRGRPSHPRELLDHVCLRTRFSNGNTPIWTFEKDGRTLSVDPLAQLIVHAGDASDLMVETALADGGIVRLFEDWLRPHLASSRLEPVLQNWWPRFSGPYLYYPGRHWVPAPLQAFIDFIKAPRTE